MKYIFSIFFFFTLVNPAFVSPVLANDFSVPNGLEGKVEFWKLIFSQYGKTHRVFHFRSHPEVIYSVLDLSEYMDPNDKENKVLLKKRRDSIDAEISAIRNSLTYLSKGKAPRSRLDSRIQQLFAKFGPGTAKYKKALKKKEIRYQRGIREKFEQGLIRSGRYLNVIEQILTAENLPTEIGRLPLVESSFDYEAFSSVGAAGIWQFMRSTGKLYMNVNYAIDERRDPIIATRAAAQYLKNSYQDLAQWPLAITSYNHGLGGVRNAVKKSGSKHLPTIIKKYKSKTFGFASSNFYAEFLAALEIEQNAQKYFPGLVREQAWSFDEVELGRSIFFNDLVRIEGGDTERIKQLNLAFRSPITSNKVKIPQGTVVKVPPGRANNLVSNISGSKVHNLSSGLVKAKRIAPNYSSYKVRKGDTLSRIASKYRVSLNSLRRANGLKNRSVIRIGQKIKIPGAGYSRSSSSRNNKRATKKRARIHKVKKGQTLSSISRKYKVSLSKLLKYNRLSSKKPIRVGQRIKIP